MKLIPGLLAITTLLVAGGALAQTPSDHMEQRIDTRQARQEQHIDHGVESGKLTQREATRLEHQQAHIDHAENRALADGSLNRREALRMEKMQDRAKRSIRHQKHDRQHAR